MAEVTVVVPTHNRMTLLRLTLRSLLDQRGVDLEVVVVDDGSSDGSEQMVRAIGDPRLRLIRHTVAQRVSAARNRGLAEAGGEWVAFCDDDDLWAPDKLRRQLDAARAEGRQWAYAGVVNVGRDLRILSLAPLPGPAEVVAGLRRYNAVPGGGSNVVAHRSLLERVGPFDVRLRNTEDWELWLRLAGEGPPACAPAPLVAYRVHGGNASLDVAEIVAGLALIQRRHGIRVDRGFIHRWLAESCLRSGDRTAALRHFALAAASGQAAGVANDLVVLGRRRLGLPARARGGSAVAWRLEARAWLDRLADQEADGAP